MAGTMQRSDVVLADLDDFLRSQTHSVNNNNTKIILAVASDTSSLLPCCKQSLGELLLTWLQVILIANMLAIYLMLLLVKQASRTPRYPNSGHLLIGRMMIVHYIGRIYTSSAYANIVRVRVSIFNADSLYIVPDQSSCASLLRLDICWV